MNHYTPNFYIQPRIIKKGKKTLEYICCIFSNGKGGHHLQWVNKQNIKVQE